MRYKKICFTLLLGLSIKVSALHSPLGIMDNHSFSTLSIVDPQSTYFGEFRPFLAAYHRQASEAFGRCLSTTGDNYSSLFHGKDSFKISELFENSTLPIIYDENTKNDIYVDGKITPKFTYREDGVIFGFEVGRLVGVKEDIRLGLKIKVPLKGICVKNEKGWDSLAVELDASGNANIERTVAGDNRIKFNEEKMYFAAPVDFLFKENIIKKEKNSEQINYVVNTINSVGAASSLDAPADINGVSPDITITLDSIKKGGMGTEDSANAPGFALVIDKNNIPYDVSKNPQPTVKNNTDPNLLYVPLQSITNKSNKAINIIFQTDPLYVEPKILTPKFNMENDIIKNWVALIGFSDEKNFKNPLRNSVKKTKSPNSGELSNENIDLLTNKSIELKNIGIIAVAVTHTSSLNDEFCQFNPAPVIVQKALLGDSPPTVLAKSGVFFGTKDLKDSGKQTLQSNTSLNTLEPGIVASDSWIDKKNGTFIIADEDLFTSSDNTRYSGYNGNAEDQYGAFWFEANYKNLPEDRKDLYITTSLGIDGEPTSTSLKMFKFLKNLEDPGYEKKELELDLSGSAHLGVKGNTYTDYQNSGFGDTDIELSVGKNFLSNKLETNIVAGIVFPTASLKGCNQINYLYESLGNNGHFEGRLALEGMYHISHWIKAIGYASFTHVFSDSEEVINTFKKAKAFGMQPATTKSNISWNQFVGSFDLSFRGDMFGMNLGYQFVHKFKDQVDSCKKIGLMAVGAYQNLSYDLKTALSIRESHKIRGSLMTTCSEHMAFELGFSETFAGKNSPKDHEAFLRITYLF